MDQTNLYQAISDSPPETNIINGRILLANNKNKWHLCASSATSVEHACGQGAPYNPDSDRTIMSDEYVKSQFQKNTEVSTPKQALEKGRICSNCLRIMEREFDLTRMVIAVGDDRAENIERFTDKLEELE